jgi:hypothetical protein
MKTITKKVTNTTNNKEGNIMDNMSVFKEFAGRTRKEIESIEIKKLKGNFIINENEWYTEKRSNNRNMAGSQSKKLKTETIEFNRFLASRGLDISHLIIKPIIAFSNDNFKIEKKPSFYEVLKLGQIDDFIVNSRRRMDETDVIEAMVLLEPYTREVLKT